MAKSSIRLDRRVKVGSKTVTLPQLERRLEEVRRGMADFQPPHRHISILLDRWVQLNFRSEGGNVGGWAPLAAGGRWVGEGRSRRFDETAKILQDTGRLRLSFLPFASGDRAGIGSDLPYSGVHNFGSTKKNIPERRLLPEPGDVDDQINRIIENHITEKSKL